MFRRNIKKGFAIVGLISMVAVLLLAACSSKSTTPAVTTAPSTSAAVTTSSATFQTMAASGQTVYSNSCASCHGAGGQGGGGPALWGSSATLGTYKGNNIFNKNAQDMLTFISSKMPLGAPGSLTHEQYIEILSYILLQGNQVSGSTVFNEDQLNTITLK